MRAGRVENGYVFSNMHSDCYLGSVFKFATIKFATVTYNISGAVANLCWQSMMANLYVAKFNVANLNRHGFFFTLHRLLMILKNKEKNALYLFHMRWSKVSGKEIHMKHIYKTT